MKIREYIKNKLVIPEELFYSLFLLSCGILLILYNDKIIGTTEIIGIILCQLSIMLPYVFSKDNS